MGQQLLKDCQAISTMKLLIVLSFVPLFSASPFSSGSTSSSVGKFDIDALISNLETIAMDPAAATAISKIFSMDNICLKNINEALEPIVETKTSSGSPADNICSPSSESGF